MAGSIRHLLERNNRYYARLTVPVALRGVVGKRELTEALDADKRIAYRMLPAALANMHRTIDAARIQTKTVAKARTQPIRGKRMSPNEMAIAHYNDQVRFDSEARNTDYRYSMGFIDDDYVAALERAISGSAPNPELVDTVGRIIRHYEINGNTNVMQGSAEWRELASALAVAELEGLKRTAERDDGIFDGKPSHPILVEQPKPALATDPLAARITGPDSLLTLGELLPKYLAERQMGPSSQNEQGVSVRMFDEFFGEPRPVYKITRRDVIDYKNALLELPAHYQKRFPKLNMREATTANKKLPAPYPLLKPHTVNAKWLSCLRTLLNWCVSNDVIPDNPANGIKPNYQASSKPPRVNFDPTDLTRIFSKSLFGCSKPWGETQWAYLLSLYCGTRPSELAQVKLDSIGQERDILVMRIQEETKNSGSQRTIPIHSELVRLGFETHVAALRKGGKTHLFPEWYGDGQKARSSADAKAKVTGIPITLDKHYPKFIPRRFNVTYRKKVGITDSRKDFYSFRHTFKTGLAQAGVPRDIRDNLTGHADSSAGSVYVHDVSLIAMKDGIEKLKFEGLESLIRK